MLNHSSHSTNAFLTGLHPKNVRQPVDDEPPRKPDWVIIMIGILILVTLLVVWLVGVPLLYS